MKTIILVITLGVIGCAAPGKCRPSKGSKDYAQCPPSHWEINRVQCDTDPKHKHYDTSHKRYLDQVAAL